MCFTKSKPNLGKTVIRHVLLPIVCQVVCAASVQAAAPGGHDQDLRHVSRLLHFCLLPRVPHLRPPAGLQDMGLPWDDGPGAALSAH
jgi:hypothetical protein